MNLKINKLNKVEQFEKIAEMIEKLKDNEQLNVMISKKITKEMRSLAQNRTFYKLFTDIGNHLWEDKDDVHDMLLAWVFWTREVKLWRITKDILIEKHTSELDKIKWKKFIDMILAFTKKYDMPITVDSREVQSLYDSYK